MKNEEQNRQNQQDIQLPPDRYEQIPTIAPEQLKDEQQTSDNKDY